MTIATITWPSIFPQAPKDDFIWEEDLRTIRTDFDSGPARVRRRFTTGPTQATVAWSMDGRQMEIFEAWYRHILHDGAEWFNFPVPRPSFVEGVSLIEYVLHVVRFVQYSTSVLGINHWLVSAKIELEERETLSADDIAGLLTLTAQEIYDFDQSTDLQNEEIHEILPTTSIW